MNRPRAHRGFSLVEFMVAMAIGLLLMAATAAVYVNSKGIFRVQRAVSSMQDNGRFAIETLSRDLRLAGYGGCIGMAAAVNFLNGPTAFLYNFAQGLQGFDASGQAWLPALDSSITAGSTVSPLPGTDVLTIRRPEGEAFALSTPWMSTPNDAPHADPATLSAAGIQSGQFLLISDCTAANVFQVSNDDSQTTGYLQHATAGTPGNSTAALSQIFGTEARVQRLVTATYFIASSVTLPGNNALWVRLGGDAPAELAEGIDSMQILYGEDLDGDQTANRYVSASQVADMNNVVSVRISLLLRSLEDNIAHAPQTYVFNDAAPVTPADLRLRTVLTTVVNLRNRTP